MLFEISKEFYFFLLFIFDMGMFKIPYKKKTSYYYKACQFTLIILNTCYLLLFNIIVIRKS